MTDAITVQPAIVCTGCSTRRALYVSGFHAPGPDRVHERCAHVRAFMLKHPGTRFEAVFLSEANAGKYMTERKVKNIGVERAFGDKMPRDLWIVVSW